MADLEPNDTYQDRGLIKITDGSYVVDVTSEGELKTKFGSSNIIKSGGNDLIRVQDHTTANILNKVLKELKKMNIHLSKITDEVIENKELV